MLIKTESPSSTLTEPSSYLQQKIERLSDLFGANRKFELLETGRDLFCASPAKPSKMSHYPYAWQRRFRHEAQRLLKELDVRK